MNRSTKRFWILAAGLLITASSQAGCHTVSQCPIPQDMANWTIPPPLPPESDSYDVVGYRDGIRFYVVMYNANLYRSGDIRSARGADALKELGVKKEGWAVNKALGEYYRLQANIFDAAPLVQTMKNTIAADG